MGYDVPPMCSPPVLPPSPARFGRESLYFAEGCHLYIAATGRSRISVIVENDAEDFFWKLSSPYVNVRGMRLSLVVETGDGVVDRAFESIGIGDGAIGQIMLLEVAPASFDVVQFGGVFR